MIAASRSLPLEPLPISEAPARLLGWCRRHPVDALLAAAALAVLVYFFGFFKIFINGSHSTALWAWEAWNPENNQEHSVLVLPIFFFLLWYHRGELASTRKESWNGGLFIMACGVGCFVLAARALQPRISIFALPLIIYGAVGYLWGRATARILLFPCVFLLFMIPVGGLVQGTVSLQILVSSVCNALASIFGVKIEATGTTIRSLDGSFNFEIAEGCSGIRSLMAMTTLTALYVHFTQREWWKKGVIFAGSLVFAVVGNIVRIFTVILVAKFISPTFAAKIYHDYSGFVFFPIAVLAMVGFAHLVNLDWAAIVTQRMEPITPEGNLPDLPDKPAESSKAPSPVSYDY
jgi:exosortase